MSGVKWTARARRHLPMVAAYLALALVAYTVGVLLGFALFTGLMAVAT